MAEGETKARPWLRSLLVSIKRATVAAMIFAGAQAAIYVLAATVALLALLMTARG